MLAKTLSEQSGKSLITTSIETSVDDAMELLISNKIGCLPVVDEKNRLVGIVSDKDIFIKIYETKGDYHGLQVRDIMARDLIVGVPDDDIAYIAGLMDKNLIRHVPIVDGEKIVGLISQRDIIRTQAANAEIENRYLRLYTGGISTRDQSAGS